MSRERVLEEILSLPNNNILIELSTGFGKTRVAIELMKQRRAKKVLVAVPRNTLKDTWKAELNKWLVNSTTFSIEFTTYVSLPKYAGKWDMVIFDECHHLSERCREALCSFNIKNSILLSATVNSKLKDELNEIFSNLYCYKVSTKEAIKGGVLPDPKVILFPIQLDNTTPSETIIVNPNGRGLVKVDYPKIWAARKDKKTKYSVSLTERQYYNEISNAIEWYKRKRFLEYMKNKWLRSCGERLKWLSDKKMHYTLHILAKLNKHRTLTFCGSIEQTELLGEYCINSKNKDSRYYMSLFNSGRINHITAASMLDEGANLASCKVGIFNNLNGSERIRVQRVGRILRHQEPVIIIPYFKDTREQEIVEEMLADYNPELITVVNSIDEIVI